MKKTALMATGLLLGSAMIMTPVLAAEDDIAEVAGTGAGFVGLGMAYKPDYEGSDDYEGGVAPFGHTIAER